MKTWRLKAVLFACAWPALSSAAFAQAVVLLPDTSQTTTVSANVNEQARVIVPSAVTFTVANIGVSTTATAASVTVDQIVTASASKQLKISLQANAASFTPPVSGAVTWAASDITWNAASWTNATPFARTPSNSIEV